ncbi:MAG: alpha/beta hydrolase-fold protein, partial [Psychrosphaera sp.]|nr:alpha/beta hydrolase-fold protein [Psychrosphaera sp.]
MNLKTTFFTIILLCQFVLGKGALANEKITPVTLDLGEKITLPSKIMGNQRELYVRLPPGFSESKQHYPVIYLLDANLYYVKDLYFHSIALIDRMTKNGTVGTIPQSIIVAVANKDFSEWHQETTRKPEDLQRFLVEELQPWVKSNYRILDNQVLIGQSSAASMVLGILPRYPASFDMVIAVDPIFTSQKSIDKVISAYQKMPNTSATIYAAQSEKEDTDVLLIKNAVEKSNPKAVNIMREAFLQENHSSV